MLKSQPPVPQNVAVFGGGVFTEAVQSKGGHEGGPNPYDWCPYTKGKCGHRDTSRGKKMERDIGRRWLSISQGERPGPDYPSKPTL